MIKKNPNYHMGLEFQIKIVTDVIVFIIRKRHNVTSHWLILFSISPLILIISRDQRKIVQFTDKIQ